MAQTPDPTLEEVQDYVTLSDGRPSVALNEIVRRLRLNLPAAIDDFNSRLNLKIKKPQEYFLAPVMVDESHINTIIVSAGVSGEDFSPGTIKGTAQVVVYSLAERVMTPNDVANAYDRAGIIKGVLMHFLTGCVDDQDRLCWKELAWTGYSMLPQSWNIGGVAITYRCVQPPNLNNWI